MNSYSLRSERPKVEPICLSPMKESDDRGTMADRVLRKNFADEVYLT